MQEVERDEMAVWSCHTYLSTHCTTGEQKIAALIENCDTHAKYTTMCYKIIYGFHTRMKEYDKKLVHDSQLLMEFSLPEPGRHTKSNFLGKNYSPISLPLTGFPTPARNGKVCTHAYSTYSRARVTLQRAEQYYFWGFLHNKKTMLIRLHTNIEGGVPK